jgi:hypothetical protein
MSDELNLGSRENSPETIEEIPAIRVERGETPEIREINQEIVVGKPHADVEMSEKEPERGNGQGSFDMQTMMAMMQQMLQKSQEKQCKN